jgi:hypothetical protein
MVRQVPRLAEQQLAHLKREGYLVLPAALDRELLRRARDHVWSVLQAEVPRMERGKPSTWGPIEPGERTGASEVPWPDDTQLVGENQYFTAAGRRFYVHCGEEQLFRELLPLALHGIAEQCLGEGTVLTPTGPAEDGLIHGPYFNSMNGDTHKALVGVKKYQHWTDKGANEFPPPMATEQLAVPPHSPFVGALTGCRGVYCTLPQGTLGANHLQQGVVGPMQPGVNVTNNTRDGLNYGGAHADTATLTDRPGIHADSRCRLRATCYLDDCPRHCGGFTLWPRSHVPIWHHTRECMRDAVAYHPYQDPILRAIKRMHAPVETHGVAGTVVLWHAKTLHIAGLNHSSDVIRQAMIHDFCKTPASVSDPQLLDCEDDDIWRDWSAQMRAVAEEETPYAQWHAAPGGGSAYMPRL